MVRTTNVVMLHIVIFQNGMQNLTVYYTIKYQLNKRKSSEGGND